MSWLPVRLTLDTASWFSQGIISLCPELPKAGSRSTEYQFPFLWAARLQLHHGEFKGVTVPLSGRHRREVTAPHQTPGPKGIDGHFNQRRYILEGLRLTEGRRSGAKLPQSWHLEVGIGILGQL